MRPRFRAYAKAAHEIMGRLLRAGLDYYAISRLAWLGGPFALIRRRRRAAGNVTRSDTAIYMSRQGERRRGINGPDVSWPFFFFFLFH